ncbi:MAG: Hsp20/alpha crystallin family protein [Spirochaetales bacterium]|nr:Hsp20/alpha crystallin family protein [Spirochaetales bacterium]
MRYLVTRNNNSLMDGFDGIFNDFFGDWSTTCKIPSVDVKEDEKQYTVEAELPGYTEADVRIHVQNHVLTISSEKKTEAKDGKKYLVRERYYRSFERSFTLPEGIDEANISAEFKNGILDIALPKLPVEKPKQIEVKIGR